MLFFWGKKKSKTAKLSREAIDRLKQQLDEKMDEYRAIYNKLVDLGGAELPEEILDTVTGGFPPTNPTAAEDPSVVEARKRGSTPTYERPDQTN